MNKTQEVSLSTLSENYYCLHHTPWTFALGLGTLLAGGSAVVCSAIMDPFNGSLGGLGVLLLLGSLLVASWPNVPRLLIRSDAFGTRGFFGRGLKREFRVCSWETLRAVAPDSPLPDSGFVVVTTNGRAHIRGNTAGLSEVRRLFEKITCKPEAAAAIVADDYCEDEVPIELRKNWQMGVFPILMVPGFPLLFLTTLTTDTWSTNLFQVLLIGSGWLFFAVHSYHYLRGPFRIRLKGTTLTILGALGRRRWDLRDIVEMEISATDDSKRLRIRTSAGEMIVIRLKDLFGYPVFDRPVYSIRCRWSKLRTASE